MLIYHCHCIENHSNMKLKGGRKTYKSVGKRKKHRCSDRVSKGEGSKKRKISRKKKNTRILKASRPKKSKISRKKKTISTKNTQFLEGLGLKVKQHDNV